MGNGWRTATLETQEEYDFIMQGQKTFCNSYPYWINGSTNALPEANLDYTDYFANNSGIIMVWYKYIISGKRDDMLQQFTCNYLK